MGSRRRPTKAGDAPPPSPVGPPQSKQQLVTKLTKEFEAFVKANSAPAVQKWIDDKFRTDDVHKAAMAELPRTVCRNCMASGTPVLNVAPFVYFYMLKKYGLESLADMQVTQLVLALEPRQLLARQLGALARPQRRVPLQREQDELLEQDSNVDRAVRWHWWNREQICCGQNLPSKTLS